MLYSEWEDYAFKAGLRTARQKKRLLKKQHDKNLFRIYREENRLADEQCDLGYIEVNPPIQKGWKRSFILREDVAKSKDAAFFSKILERINVKKFSHRKDFKKKRRSRGRKVYVETVQRLDYLYAWQLHRKPLTEKEKLYFREEWEVSRPGHQVKRWTFTEPWHFVLKVEANMITKRRIIHPLLTSQKKELENYLEKNNLRPRQWKVIYGYYQHRDYWNPKPKACYRVILRKTPIQVYLAETRDMVGVQ